MLTIEQISSVLAPGVNWDVLSTFARIYFYTL